MASSREIAFRSGFSSLLALALIALTVRAESVPPLPKLNLDAFEADIRAQISDAYTATVRNPQDAERNGRLGMLLYAYEQYEFAEPCFRRALAFAASDRRWPYYLGRTQSTLRKHHDAASSFRAALRLDPEYLPARLKLGESLQEAGDSEAAREIFEAILTRHPEAAAAHYGLGRYFANRGESAPATDHLRKACELFPGFGAAHFALARVYRDQGEKEKAQEQLVLYQKDKLTWPPIDDPLLAAIHELKTGANARLRKGVLLAESGQLEAAVAEHEAALAADPGLVQAHIHLIALYGKLRQPEKAEAHYRSAVRINPNLLESHYNYAVLLMEQERYREAEEPLRVVLRLSPAYPDAHNNLGYVLMVEGKLDEATEHYQAAIQAQPGNRAAHFNLGRILVKQGKIQEAITQFLETRTPEDADTPRYLYALGAAYARAGDRGSARKYLGDAREKAARLNQTELIAAIDRDLQVLQKLVKMP